MFIFQSTVGIAKVHGMRPVFARNQLSLLNTIFDIFEYTAVRFEIGLVDGELEPDYQARDAEKWVPGKTYINPIQNTKIRRYLQNMGHMNEIIDVSGARVHPREFYRIRPQVLDAAKKILPGVPECVALHLRFFPANHLKAGINECPTGPVLQQQIDELATKEKCLFVFSNDAQRASEMVTAPCVHYVNPGQTEIRSDSGERHPVGLYEVARDFAALTLCDDLIISCGTFGISAAVLHSGAGNVYWWPQDPGSRHVLQSPVSKAWISYPAAS